MVGRLARERGKIAAATEVGSPGEFASRYVMSAEDEAALANSDTRRVLWYMPWRNDPGAAGTGAYGTPVEGSRYALISAVSPSILSSVWPIPFRRCTDSRIPAAIRAG